MASVKIVLRTSNKNAKGEAPLCIRITKNRRTKFIFTDYRILPDHWDEERFRVRKAHPNSTRLNAYLSKKLSDTQNNALELETKQELVLVDQIKQKSVEEPSVSYTYKGYREDHDKLFALRNELVNLTNAGRPG